jgi:hypothetical protein
LNDCDFFIKEIHQEVVSTKKKKLKEYKKICQATIATFVSSLTIALPTFAKGTQMANVPGLMPQDIIPYGIWAIVIMIVAGFFIGAVCWGLAAIKKIIAPKKKKEALEWQKDILRGVADIFSGPILLAILAMAAILFFGHFGWYIKPFQGLN